MMAQRGDETAMVLSHNDTDVPVLPVEEMERLHRFRPDVVDWILRQTEQEAEYRRQLDREAYSRLFAERRLGQLLGCLIGLAGIIGGSSVAIAGNAVAGGTIATAAIGTLAVAFLKGAKREG